MFVVVWLRSCPPERVAPRVAGARTPFVQEPRVGAESGCAPGCRACILPSLTQPPPAPGLEPESENFVAWLERTNVARPGFKRTRRPSQIPRALTSHSLRVAFQPIVELPSRKIYAYEALLRSDAPGAGPEELIADAIRHQCVGALGRVVREMATRTCPDYPIFLNVHPKELDEGWLVQPDDPIFTHRFPVYLEITEAVPLSHFTFCQSVLKEVRSKGVKLAVDDLGAGYSNLKYIADLVPDVVKLDRGLVQHADREPRKQLLLRHLVGLCVDLGAKVVAEGIETKEEYDFFVDIGAHYAQGYFLARPSFPPPALDPL